MGEFALIDFEGRGGQTVPPSGSRSASRSAVRRARHRCSRSHPVLGRVEDAPDRRADDGEVEQHLSRDHQARRIGRDVMSPKPTVEKMVL
jgi:hypothetical protein